MTKHKKSSPKPDPAAILFVLALSIAGFVAGWMLIELISK